jgi:hypothetical protein
MEVYSGGSFYMEKDFGGIFQYGGGFRGQFYLRSQILEAFVLLSVYKRDVSLKKKIWRPMWGAGLHMEADFRGNFQAGGGFWGRV